MNLTDYNPRAHAETEIRAERQVQQEREYRLIGSSRHRPGMTLFAVNTRTGDVHPAEYVKESTISFADAQQPLTRRKIQVEQDCIYIEALNERTANQKVIRAIKRQIRRSLDDITI